MAAAPELQTLQANIFHGLALSHIEDILSSIGACNDDLGMLGGHNPDRCSAVPETVRSQSRSTLYVPLPISS